LNETDQIIASVIAEMPDWTSIEKSEWSKCRIPTSRGAATVARHLAAFDLDAVRSGVGRYAEDARQGSGLTVEAAGRLLILNRLVFVVPEWSDGSVGFFGGFAGPEGAGGRLQIGWPVVTLPDGSVEIAAPFRGYFGDDFQALPEFDLFRERFPRRPWS
jgi:hypothetical protein